MPPRLNSNQLRKDLPVIENNIKKLDKQYTEFLEGATSTEPKALRAQTENLIAQWRRTPVASTMLRFQLQNVVQRYNAHREKWERLLRIKFKNEKLDDL